MKRFLGCWYFTLTHKLICVAFQLYIRFDLLTFGRCTKRHVEQFNVSLCAATESQTRRPASADRTARRQFHAVFPVITGSFPTNIIAHLHGLSMDLTMLTVGQTVGPAVDSTVGWTVGLKVKLCKHWFDSRSNYWSNCGNHWPTSEPNTG